MIEPVTSGTLNKQLPSYVGRLATILILVGGLGCVAAYMIDPAQASFNHIIAYLFLTSIAVGSIFLIALEHLAGAVWSVPMRRANEFLAGLTVIVPLLAIPMFWHLGEIFHWTHTEVLAAEIVLQAKAPYLNVTFFVIRFVGIWLIWNLFYLLFVRNSNAQDISRDERLTKRNVRLAAVFMPVFGITISVMAIDWAMSLEPHWFSTILGVYYFSGTVLAALAIGTFVIVKFHEHNLLPRLRADHFYSLGALMFGFVNFWAYIAFSQFLLIWYANIPEETYWFMNRWKNGWEFVSVALIFVHFVVPYFLLLSQESKMDLKRLKFVALWILFAHFVDLYWLVMPTHSPSFSIGWMELAFPLFSVGLILMLLLFKVRRHNVVPIGDPKLQRGLDFRL